MIMFYHMNLIARSYVVHVTWNTWNEFSHADTNSLVTCSKKMAFYKLHATARLSPYTRVS